MPDNTEQPADGAAPRDPWAPPQTRVPLDKKSDAGRPPAGGAPEDARPPTDGAPGTTRPPTDGAPGTTRPPTVHDQLTVTSMPGVGTGPVPPVGFTGPESGQQPGPAGWPGPGTAPPPPVGPNGPGQAPPQYGYPGTQPSQYGYPGGQPSQYGYPAAQQPQHGYPAYPGYGQTWGGPQPANGMGVASLVLGIIATVAFCMLGLGIVLGILALIFGLIGRGRVRDGAADNGGVALAGIILGSIGIVVSAAFLGLTIWAANTDDYDEDSGSDYEPAALSLVVEAPQHAPLGGISLRA
ncbi:DUF4190 domain-containing protein [Streptomyces sp. A1277]|uniref:DUF4190 domain-containing protein n=1 Tax=Streptomyces sp. A1277 TaxID=2563103 RepID=UPI0010A26335|nr:DUF4190 domain-containing protein [Streptomyces sp. A1277]THA30466.1 DUF4190 domain-containing protein [Streptomyces sp. A1277]